MSYSKVGSNLPYPNATTLGLFVEEIEEFKADSVVVVLGATKEAFERYLIDRHVTVSGVEFKLIGRFTEVATDSGFSVFRFRAMLELDMFYSAEELTLRARVLQAIEDSKVEF